MRQAVPATPENLRDAIRLSRNERVRLVLALMWQAGARYSVRRALSAAAGLRRDPGAGPSASLGGRATLTPRGQRWAWSSPCGRTLISAALLQTPGEGYSSRSVTCARIVGRPETRLPGPHGPLGTEGRADTTSAPGRAAGEHPPPVEALVHRHAPSLPPRDGTGGDAGVGGAIRSAVAGGGSPSAGRARQLASLHAVVHRGYPDFPDESDAGPSSWSVFTTYSGNIEVVHRRRAGRPSAPLPLQPISTTRLNIPRLQHIDVAGHFRHGAAVLYDADLFQSLIIAPLPAHQAVSRDTLHLAADLRKYDVVRDCPAPLVVLPLFLTRKRSTPTARLLLDARRLNAAFARPPPMPIPRLRELVDGLLRRRYAVLADGVNWFYQFGLSDAVGAYFGVRLGGDRGGAARAEPVNLALTVMAMGWSWAPFLGQSGANALLGDSRARSNGWAWVDNFILTGMTEREVAGEWAAFAARCHLVGAEMHAETGQLGDPQQRFRTLGMEFDLARPVQAVRLDPAWVATFAGRGAWRSVRGGRAWWRTHT
eukprot:TRINITY_DN6418_c0_g1_i2.p1 TRINITY_DN6418_c0_g1~~TRINITY_DN6418_c0_g1_i2.p1  ORF type:complete len:539 (-),score=15.24 TRINITY_DN6418_c0_g1_i2:39-1655(-)